MTTPSKDLAARVAAGGTALDKKGDTVFDLLERQKSQIERALPKNMSAERLLRVVLTEVRRNPKLGECSPQSLLGALMLSAQLGLEPGPLGQAYFVPFANEVTFIIGYKGLISLALRSEKIVSIEGHEVCENDNFEFDYGTGLIKHSYNLIKPRGNVIAYYAKAALANGGHVMRVMTMEDVNKRKARSKAKDSGPWKTDADAMGIKTAIRALCSQLPLTPEAERALLADEGTTDSQTTADSINVTAKIDYGESEEVIDVSSDELDEQFQTAMEGDD